MRRKIAGSRRFGQQMQVARKSHHLTQEVVARQMHVHPDKLRRFERGEQFPLPDEFKAFCGVVGLTDIEVEPLRHLYHTIASGGGPETVSGSLTTERLTFGGHELAYVVLDGVALRSGMPCENIEIHIDETPIEIPNELQFFYDRYVEEVERRRQTAVRAPYDGPLFAVRAIGVSRTPGTEEPLWRCTLQRTSYFRYMALVKNLDSAYVADGRYTTIRKAYVWRAHFDPNQPPVIVSNFGVGLSVYTQRDDRLVFVRRGRTEMYPAMFGTAVAEGLHPDKDFDRAQDPSTSVIRCALRGAQEELGVEVTPDALTLLLLGYSPHDCLYGCEGVLSVDCSVDELRESMVVAHDGAYEIANIFSISARPLIRALQELFQITRRENLIWHPGYLANVLMALRFFNQDAYARCSRLLRMHPERFGTPIPDQLLFPTLPPFIDMAPPAKPQKPHAPPPTGYQ